MKYAPSIFVTVDIILLRESELQKEILLIQRLREPFKDFWALPGGFLEKGETPEAGAKRELEEETSVSVKELYQFRTYGNPDRDPRGHTISIVYTGFVPYETTVQGKDDAKEAQWFKLENLPPLAFDHALIIEEYKNSEWYQ